MMSSPLRYNAEDLLSRIRARKSADIRNPNNFNVTNDHDVIDESLNDSSSSNISRKNDIKGSNMNRNTANNNINHEIIGTCDLKENGSNYKEKEPLKIDNYSLSTNRIDNNDNYNLNERSHINSNTNNDSIRHDSHLQYDEFNNNNSDYSRSKDKNDMKHHEKFPSSESNKNAYDGNNSFIDNFIENYNYSHSPSKNGNNIHDNDKNTRNDIENAINDTNQGLKNDNYDGNNQEAITPPEMQYSQSTEIDDMPYKAEMFNVIHDLKKENLSLIKTNKKLMNEKSIFESQIIDIRKKNNEIVAALRSQNVSLSKQIKTQKSENEKSSSISQKKDLNLSIRKKNKILLSGNSKHDNNDSDDNSENNKNCNNKKYLTTHTHNEAISNKNNDLKDKHENNLRYQNKSYQQKPPSPPARPLNSAMVTPIGQTLRLKISTQNLSLDKNISPITPRTAKNLREILPTEEKVKLDENLIENIYYYDDNKNNFMNNPIYMKKLESYNYGHDDHNDHNNNHNDDQNDSNNCNHNNYKNDDYDNSNRTENESNTNILSNYGQFYKFTPRLNDSPNENSAIENKEKIDIDINKSKEFQRFRKFNLLRKSNHGFIHLNRTPSESRTSTPPVPLGLGLGTPSDTPSGTSTPPVPPSNIPDSPRSDDDPPSPPPPPPPFLPPSLPFHRLNTTDKSDNNGYNDNSCNSNEYKSKNSNSDDNDDSDDSNDENKVQNHDSKYDNENNKNCDHLNNNILINKNTSSSQSTVDGGPVVHGYAGPTFNELMRRITPLEKAFPDTLGKYQKIDIRDGSKKDMKNRSQSREKIKK